MTRMLRVPPSLTSAPRTETRISTLLATILGSIRDEDHRFGFVGRVLSWLTIPGLSLLSVASCAGTRHGELGSMSAVTPRSGQPASIIGRSSTPICRYWRWSSIASLRNS
jgi:hypothetical protein